MENVLRANRAFYDAFEDYDIDLMQEVWSDADYSRCTHPGWKTMYGWTAIRQGWEGIFSGPVRMKFDLRNVEADIIGDIAVVSLTEEIVSVGAAGTDRYMVVASNVFERKVDRWSMILHHGSAYSLPETSPRFN